MAASDHQTHVLERRKVLQRTSSQCHQVRGLAWGQRPEGEGFQDLLGRQPGPVQMPCLAGVDPWRDWAVAQVGPVDHPPLGLDEPTEVLRGRAELGSLSPERVDVQRRHDTQTSGQSLERAYGEPVGPWAMRQLVHASPQRPLDLSLALAMRLTMASAW